MLARQDFSAFGLIPTLRLIHNTVFSKTTTKHQAVRYEQPDVFITTALKIPLNAGFNAQ